MEPSKHKLRDLESKLQDMYAKGREENVYVGGYGGGHLMADSFDAVEQHEHQRRQLAREVKEARSRVKEERAQLKEHAAGVNDPSSWTKKVLDGDSRFASSSDESAFSLAQATYGLKSHAEFRETKERLAEEERVALEAASREDAQRRQNALTEKKERQKRKRREQASKLSFEDEDG
mmetsp:Transcript_46183/g.76365  ORF Transcript_46183/g.76365 Transcript_46183/m.76365 type:complete len:177 (-) Transcript_46183:65-595(-)|eukprot:CAMPEP_0119325348 /NCGR_PEP_ID=MMETSP1333-20130426/65577_1 /TAXON_ID=418940 /ORGANISM="Scyphosphaera apsteinii, Strain RCC1455" /LENGTH=176 /DNA_ID=CAMNT_0007333313 /DNA_START=104 /DNA_END=634 /DNA_ORIENTATION=+